MSNKEQVQIIIDANEEAQNTELTELFVLHEDVEKFNIEPLETGDFIVEDCIFERKTPSDFASSLEKGRLRKQVERLSDEEKRAWVLIEGNMEDFDDLEHTNISPKSLRGMDASIEGRYGVGVKYCSNAGNLADIAIRTARKTVEEPSQTYISNSNTVKEASFIVKFYMNFDGIGLETAEKLAEEFDAVQTALDADISELTEVDGVGDTRAEEIYETLHNTTIDDSNDEESGVSMVRI